MRTLAIETASEACSLALFDGDRLLANEHREIGRGHAETLIPMIANLPNKGRADAIRVSLGPGSFTGVRIGIATARALGFAWGAQVIGYPTLALLAQMARQQAGASDVTICMNGGHGEWFIQNFDAGGPGDAPRSLRPDEAVTNCRCGIIAGNRAAELAKLVGGEVRALSILPDARAAMRLSSDLLTDNLTPNYGRAPDAKPQREPAG